MSTYFGHYQYDKYSIDRNAPDVIGVYYCGYVDSRGMLIPYYVGRAIGDGVTIRDRLLAHYRENKWYDVTHFGYSSCSSRFEARLLEKNEIKRLQPKYNKAGKA